MTRPKRRKALTILITLPALHTIFQARKRSGKSLYLRGIPFNPRKCIGKKVILTPMNITQNTAVEPVLFITPPKKSGLHKVTPPRIPNTAPSERT